MAETTYRPFGKKAPMVRLIVRRVKPTPGSQLALFTTYSYHAMITDRQGSTVELEADHRRHAVVEDAIRDLKYGVGLNHLPSGRFGANAAWLAFNVSAHNVARWTSRLGLGLRLRPPAAATHDPFGQRHAERWTNRLLQFARHEVMSQTITVGSLGYCRWAADATRCATRLCIAISPLVLAPIYSLERWHS